MQYYSFNWKHRRRFSTDDFYMYQFFMYRDSLRRECVKQPPIFRLTLEIQVNDSHLVIHEVFPVIPDRNSSRKTQSLCVNSEIHGDRCITNPYPVLEWEVQVV